MGRCQGIVVDCMLVGMHHKVFFQQKYEVDTSVLANIPTTTDMQQLLGQYVPSLHNVLCETLRTLHAHQR